MDAREMGVSHIGIIMDGNGRWAKKRLMPRKMGHKFGAKTFRTITDHCRDMNLSCLTVYAFSTENWSRPQDEVDAIMALLRDYLEEVFRERDSYIKKNMRIRFLGDIAPLASDLQEKMRELEEITADLRGMTLQVAVNYGGRADIIQAARQLAREAVAGTLSPEDITEELFSQKLYTQGEPDPDLIVRTGGEYRLSNFLTWQAAYAEYVATPTLWPDFSPDELDELLRVFSGRDRRFGGVKE